MAANGGAAMAAVEEPLGMPAQSGRGLRQQIACFELPRFMDTPVLEPPQDVLDVVQARSEVVKQSEQREQQQRILAMDSAPQQVPAASPQLTHREQPFFSSSHPSKASALTKHRDQKVGHLPPSQASPLLVHREQCQVLSSYGQPPTATASEFANASLGALEQSLGALQHLQAQLQATSSEQVAVPSPERKLSKQSATSNDAVLSYVMPLSIPVQEMAEPSAAHPAPSAPVCISGSQSPRPSHRQLQPICHLETSSVSRSSTRSNFSGSPGPSRIPPLTVATKQQPQQPQQGAGAREHRASNSYMPAVVAEAPPLCSYRPGPQRDSAELQVSARQQQALARAAATEHGAIPDSASIDVSAAYSTLCMSTGTMASVLLPHTVAMMSPQAEARTIHCAENCASFLPSPVAPSSPTAAYRQVPQQQQPPLSRSKSLETPGCIRSSIGRGAPRRGGQYHIPAALGVDQPAQSAQSLRSTSPAAGFRWIGAAPQRNSKRHAGPSASPSAGAAKPAHHAGPVAMAQRKGNFVEELLYSGSTFDPTVPGVRTSLFEKLNAPKQATVVLMRQDGGMNEGMWVLNSPSGSLILKLVPHERRHPMIPSEAEQFVKLAREHPAMIEDAALAFPVKIFACREQTREKPSFDLVVMRKAPGVSFADLVSRRCYKNQRAEMMRDLHAMGYFLADVHARHKMQHGDFTLSNVFYDEATGTFTMVDVSDFGPQLCAATESDTERFCNGMLILSRCHGEHLYTEGRPNFEAGYRERMAKIK